MMLMRMAVAMIVAVAVPVFMPMFMSMIMGVRLARICRAVETGMRVVMIVIGVVGMHAGRGKG